MLHLTHSYLFCASAASAAVTAQFYGMSVTPPLSFVGGVNRCFGKVELNGAFRNPAGAVVDKNRNAQTLHSKPQTRSEPLGGDRLVSLIAIFLVLFFFLTKNGSISEVFLEIRSYR